MPYATNPDDGVRLYYEVEGDGPPLILHHGGGRSIQRWRDNRYDEMLRDDFRLIFFDARGHGRSDKPHVPEAYPYRKWVSDVVAILDHLEIEQAHFFGYSLGALVGFRIPVYAPNRFRSLLLGGGHPYELYDFYDRQYETFRDGIDGLIARRDQAGNPVTPEERAGLQEVDAVLSATAALAFRDEPGVEDRLPDVTIPTLLYCGAADTTASTNHRLPEAARLIPDAILIVFNSLDHSQAFRRSERIVPHVRAFLQQVEADNAGVVEDESVERGE